MRKLIFLLSLAFLGIGTTAHAICEPSPSGPSCAGGLCWYDYTPSSNCWDLSGSVSGTSACYSDGYEFGVYSGSLVSYTFTIGQSDPVTGSFSFAAYVDFVDPNDSASNQIQGWAYVVHNGIGSFTSLFSHSGATGDLSCARLYGNFDAVRGDTVTVAIEVAKANSNTSIKATGLFLYTWY